ncbi:nitroreductase family deazaflavin-dependent oxidoreductase [Ornithinimicrobium ciconiae]|uniref:Nitroreductase family deazaflavin-dependent oxidoreductase n=1 Tax=Ornithinimicrobium ciconiae TaxID=2594265 RepID=A0A516G9P2_9MICO|nr:nitroreductase/quinone reductase family protein [Ornithinimicrobium ciconiae]QDO88246.1 nitroreductase family deazaflavin-dependent oxidoreductase [Ornithinimicrobium ciconiae]
MTQHASSDHDAPAEPSALTGRAPTPPARNAHHITPHNTPRNAPRVSPRWFATRAWATHRNIHRLTGGHLGLWRPRRGGWGTLRVTTTGRRTGQDRSVILGYLEDGADLVTLAMNGWREGEPSWWLNLQTQPDALVETREGARAVRARTASGEEATRLWTLWQDAIRGLDARAAGRATPTTLVLLTPRR